MIENSENSQIAQAAQSITGGTGPRTGKLLSSYPLMVEFAAPLVARLQERGLPRREDLVDRRLISFERARYITKLDRMLQEFDVIERRFLPVIKFTPDAIAMAEMAELEPEIAYAWKINYYKKKYGLLPDYPLRNAPAEVGFGHNKGFLLLRHSPFLRDQIPDILEGIEARHIFTHLALDRAVYPVEFPSFVFGSTELRAFARGQLIDNQNQSYFAFKPFAAGVARILGEPPEKKFAKFLQASNLAGKALITYEELLERRKAKSTKQPRTKPATPPGTESVTPPRTNVTPQYELIDDFAADITYIRPVRTPHPPAPRAPTPAKPKPMRPRKSVRAAKSETTSRPGRSKAAAKPDAAIQAAQAETTSPRKTVTATARPISPPSAIARFSQLIRGHARDMRTDRGNPIITSERLRQWLIVRFSEENRSLDAKTLAVMAGPMVRLFDGGGTLLIDGNLTPAAAELVRRVGASGLELIGALPELSGELLYSDKVRRMENAAPLRRFMEENNIYTFAALERESGIVFRPEPRQRIHTALWSEGDTFNADQDQMIEELLFPAFRAVVDRRATTNRPLIQEPAPSGPANDC